MKRSSTQFFAFAAPVVAALLLTVGSACVRPAPRGGGGEARDGGGGPPGAGGTEGPGPGARRDAGAPAAGEKRDTLRYLAECAQLNHACDASRDAGAHCGQCQYRVRYDPQQCTRAKPCDRLFLLWAAMGCDGDRVRDGLDAVLDAHPGYVAACAQPLYPGEMLPTTLGAPERENLLMDELFTALKSGAETGVWSGKQLLMAGCSAGGSRYPVVAARYPDEVRWLASEKNAACFSDGVVSIPFQDKFIGQGMGSGADGGTQCAARHGRIARGYTTASPGTGHSCAVSPAGQCACDPSHAFVSYPGDCGGSDCVSFDSIVEETSAGFAFSPGVGADSFAVRNWKLVSEGDAFRNTPQRCVADVVPEAPFKGLCAAIDADPNHRCDFVSVPNATHCSDFDRNLGKHCVEWFEALPQ